MEKKELISYHLSHLKQLVFEVTESCNLNCRYCGLSKLYNGYTNRNGKKLPFSKARLILDYLFSIRDNSPDINYPLNIGFYGGEPLLAMNLIKQIVKYIKNQQHIKVIYGMTTNALLLNKYMNFLVENKFQLVISLDGDETCQSYRVDHSGKNSFHTVFKNIKLFQNKYPEYFRNYVQFNSVLHNRNSVEKTYRFIKDHFNKIPLVAPLNLVGVNKEQASDFKKMYQNVHENILMSYPLYQTRLPKLIKRQ